jgi:hypothetical protein
VQHWGRSLLRQNNVAGSGIMLLIGHQGGFNNIPHDLLMKAIRKHCEKKRINKKI